MQLFRFILLVLLLCAGSAYAQEKTTEPAKQEEGTAALLKQENAIRQEIEKLTQHIATLRHKMHTYHTELAQKDAAYQDKVQALHQKMEELRRQMEAMQKVVLEHTNEWLEERRQIEQDINDLLGQIMQDEKELHRLQELLMQHGMKRGEPGK